MESVHRPPAAVAPEPESSTGSARRFYGILVALLLAGLLVRVGYLAAQPGTDPRFNDPGFDGAYYVEWARAIAGDAAIDSRPYRGAFYLAPLYPHLLALTGVDFMLLYAVQQLLGVGTAAMIALAGRRAWGEVPALCAAGLLLLYHPMLFFASAPMGETLAIFLLVGALAAMLRPSPRWGALSGAVAALAALARPNLALVVVAWALGEALGRRWKRAGALICGFLVIVLPVGLRNLVASGHFVPLSANAGITLYHGNGPRAQGVFGTLPPGVSGDVRLQRREATRAASLATGRQLDPVQADAHWRSEAVRARMEDPGGTLRLGLRRLLLTVDHRETGLDYHPDLDANPWRRLAPLPFGLLFGLAVGGLALRGVRPPSVWPCWAAILACAATPVLFYVSTRYRLPMAALLVIPAGWSLARLFTRRATLILPAAVLGALLSLSVPLTEPALQGLLAEQPDTLRSYADLRRSGRVQSLASLATANWRAGRLDAAEQQARRALELEPRSARALDLVGLVLESRGRTVEAEAAYREALAAGQGVGGRVSAASHLGALLIRRGDSTAAIPLLRDALRRSPLNPYVWHNLLTALVNAGELDDARTALMRARSLEVAVDGTLAAAIEREGEP